MVSGLPFRAPKITDRTVALYYKKVAKTIDYVYDALNRLTEKDYPDTTKAEYTYDLVGKLMGVTDPSGTYGFSYDHMGRLTGTTAQYSFLTGTTFTNAYTYDAASNRTGYTAPDGSTNTYTYDTLNRLTTLANSATGSFGFSYDALSRRTQLTRPNGINTNYSYDNLSRLLSVLHQSGTSTIDGATYTLDNAGNRTAKTDELANVTTNYGYDSIYQLLSATQGGTTTESYTYDPVGNRLSSLAVPSYTTNSSNEMTANSNATYTYDSNGNTLTKVDSTGTTTYAWDFENRLAGVTLPGSAGTVTFKYDPFGRRIEKISPATTSIFAYDGSELVEEANGSGGEAGSYTQSPNVDEHLAMLRGTALSYYEQDGLESVTSLTNSAGAVAQSYAYDSFGNTTTSSGSLTNLFRYAGRDLDTTTGLYFNRARYYDPQTARFVSQDPIGFMGGTNFYQYTSNQPVNFTDPFGLKNYNEQETAEYLARAYCDAIAGRYRGLVNIYHHSLGDFDFGWNEHGGDTFTVGGKTMTADQFGNCIAGFEGSAYDHYYFWTTGWIWAEAGVKAAGLYFHLMGFTHSPNDPLDRTGFPDIDAGEKKGTTFTCGCHR